MHRAVADFQMGFLSRRVRAHDRCASFYSNALEVCRGIDTVQPPRLDVTRGGVLLFYGLDRRRRVRPMAAAQLLAEEARSGFSRTRFFLEQCLARASDFSRAMAFSFEPEGVSQGSLRGFAAEELLRLGKSVLPVSRALPRRRRPGMRLELTTSKVRT